MRLYPDSVVIDVVERRLLAVWENNGRLGVIDATGVVAPEADPGKFARLPLVVGDGANLAAGHILPLVQSRPRLMARLDALVRVDDRRWDLRLKDGGIVQLPATDEDAALIRLDQLDQASRILDLGFSRIDLRDPRDGCSAATGESRGRFSCRVGLDETCGEGRPRGVRRSRTPRRGGRDGLKAALSRPTVTAAVDLGASKVACFIMKPDGVRPTDRTITAAGVGYVQSRGVRGGAVIDVDEAASAIAKAVERAEAMAGVTVSGVTVATAGGQLASRRVAANVSLGARPISDADLSRAIGAAVVRPASMPGRRIIHVRPIAWSVDGAKGVRDPRSMFGRQLGLQLLLVSMDEQVFQTIAHCVERAHLQFEGVVAAPFASALATLEEDEMDLGAILIDMGGGSTSLAVYAGGSLTPCRQPGGRRRPRDAGRRPRPFHLDRRRRAHQDAAWLGHRLGQRGPRDDRGAAARRRSRRRPRRGPALAAEGHHRPPRRRDA